MTGDGDQGSLRALFAGRRGKLLLGLLISEFTAAIQSVAYATMLPLASRELHGDTLYGATLVAGTLTALLILSAGPRVTSGVSIKTVLYIAVTLYVVGILMAATAPIMPLVLAGSIVQGIASGLLGSFALTAIGALYEDAVRARVLGLFAMVWLLPSFLGPVLNSVIAVNFGWRWGLVWPIVAVIVARILVGRYLDLIPVQRSTQRLDLVTGLTVVLGLGFASAAPSMPEPVAIPVFVVGVLIAIAGSARSGFRLIGRERARFRDIAALLGISLAFFGGSGLVPLLAVDGLHSGVIGSNIAYGFGIVAWSLTGLRRNHGPILGIDAAFVGMVLVAVALCVEGAVVVWMTGFAGLAIATIGWGIAGAGMGLAYPLLSARPLDGLAASAMAPAAIAVAFAEAAGTALGSIVGGGSYSLASGFGAATLPALLLGFALLAALGLVSVALTRRRPPLLTLT